MIGNWLKRRRLSKNIETFAQLLRQGDISAAHSFYEAHLSGSQAELPKALLAAYHLQRWLAMKKQADLEALQLLAAGAKAHSPLTTVWATVQRLQKDAALAHAVRYCNQSFVGAPIQVAGHPESEMLEKLALAFLETCALAQQGGADNLRREVAARVLRLLPSAQTLKGQPALEEVRAHLLVWAAAALGKYDLIWHERPALDLFSVEKRVGILLATAFGRAKMALEDHRPADAEQCFNEVSYLMGPDVQYRLSVAAGFHVLAHGSGEAAVQWFANLREQAGSAPTLWMPALDIGLAVAQFKLGKFSQARKTLQEFNQRLIAATSAEQTIAAVDYAAPPSAEEAALSQSYYLMALSFLAGARDWPTPSQPPDPARAEADQQLIVKNRALWNALREELSLIIEHLSSAAPAHAWRGHLMRGLVAYVDSNATLDGAHLAQFSSAIEQIRDAAARARLKTIEGALISRGQATAEAVRLIRQKDYKRLKELNETVLASLGDAIPALVRASVHMTLWQADPSYNPLPELQRIAVQPSDEALVNQCITQVLAVQTLKRLAEEAVSLRSSEQMLPALTPLVAFDRRAAYLGALTLAVVHLRRGDLQAARSVLNEQQAETNEPLGNYLRFYLAWRLEDVPECRRLLALNPDANPLIARYGSSERILLARGLIEALNHNQEEEAWELFLAYWMAAQTEHLSDVLFNLVIWLIKQERAPAAHSLLRQLRRRMFTDGSDDAVELRELNWLSLVLQSLVTARLGQYTACMDSVQQLLTVPPPIASIIGDESAHQRVVNWLRLIKIEAELCLTATAETDVSIRWRAVQRSLEREAAELETDAALRPYLHLIVGLLSSLGAEVIVDEETINRLRLARQSLQLETHVGFIERVISQLSWRKGLIASFWESLRAGDYQRSRAIYQQELEQAFGRRMPASIQLGMILADIGEQTDTPAELLRRLNLLEHDAPELDREFIASVRSYLQNGERILSLVQLFNAKRFKEVIELAHTTNWHGFEPGMMPIPIAIALLYAYYVTQQTEEALYMGEQISSATNLRQEWQDYGSLLLGYVLFEQQKYVPQEETEEAAAAAPYDALKQLNVKDVFERIGVSRILHHDIDRYWAAAQFNEGIKLLGADQKEKAFEAFARSFRVAGMPEQKANLASLFFYFGLKSLKTSDKYRARQGFQLAKESLSGEAASGEIAYYQLVAEFGELLCHAKFSEDVSALDGQFFLDLAPRVQSIKERLSPIDAYDLEYVLHNTAICQELHRAYRLKSNSRSALDELYLFVMEEAETLGQLAADAKEQAQALLMSGEASQQEEGLKFLARDFRRYDQTMLTLKGVCELLLAQTPDVSAALDWLDQALKLGAHSQKLAELFTHRRSLMKEALERNKSALERFDFYLADGGIPVQLREDLVRRDDLAELYRLNRTYTPNDILAAETQTGTRKLIERLDGLLKYIKGDESLKNDADLKAAAAAIEEMKSALGQTEKELLDKERRVMDILAAKIKEASKAALVGQ